MKELKLKKMGMDFPKSETAQGDIGNYRVRTSDYEVKGKDGNVYFLEFTLWRNRTQARHSHKITGKPLKHVKYDIINPQAVTIDASFQNAGGTWGNYRLANEIYKQNYSYNTSDILKIVNTISCDTYDKIIIEE